MFKTQRHFARGLLLAALVAAVPAGAEAQAFTFAGGSRTHDGDGGWSTPVFALRTEHPVGGSLLLETASSVANRRDASTRAVTSVFEAQLQLPVALGDALEPYFGAGAGVGWVSSRSESGDGLQGVLSAGAGVRAMFSEQLGFVLDARIRGVGTEFAAAHTDLSIGLRYRLLPRDRPRFRGAPASN